MENSRFEYTDEKYAERVRDLQEYFWEEYKEYVEVTPMTDYERRLLRKWVTECHSVYDDPGSKYLCRSRPSKPFLEAYREDRAIEIETRGMSRTEKDTYLKAYIGYEDPTPEELAMAEAKENTPKLVENRVRRLERDLFNLWGFIWQEGLGDEAREFVEERKNEPVPFEW